MMPRAGTFEKIAPVLNQMRGGKISETGLENLIRLHTSLYLPYQIRNFIRSLEVKGWIKPAEDPGFYLVLGTEPPALLPPAEGNKQ